MIKNGLDTITQDNFVHVVSKLGPDNYLLSRSGDGYGPAVLVKAIDGDVLTDCDVKRIEYAGVGATVNVYATSITVTIPIHSAKTFDDAFECGLEFTDPVEIMRALTEGYRHCHMHEPREYRVLHMPKWFHDVKSNVKSFYTLLGDRSYVNNDKVHLYYEDCYNELMNDHQVVKDRVEDHITDLVNGITKKNRFQTIADIARLRNLSQKPINFNMSRNYSTKNIYVLQKAMGSFSVKQIEKLNAAGVHVTVFEQDMDHVDYDHGMFVDYQVLSVVIDNAQDMNTVLNHGLDAEYDHIMHCMCDPVYNGFGATSYETFTVPTWFKDIHLDKVQPLSISSATSLQFTEVAPNVYVRNSEMLKYKDAMKKKEEAAKAKMCKSCGVRDPLNDPRPTKKRRKSNSKK